MNTADVETTAPGQGAPAALVTATPTADHVSPLAPLTIAVGAHPKAGVVVLDFGDRGRVALPIHQARELVRMLRQQINALVRWERDQTGSPVRKNGRRRGGRR